MKKLKLLFIGVFVVLLVTGCNTEKTLTCTNSIEDSGIKMEQEIVMKFKNNKINYVKMIVNSKATSDVIKSNWDVFASTMDSQYIPKETNGVKLTTSNDKENYQYNITLEVNLEKASNDSLKEYNLDGIADEDSSIDEVKKSAEKDGYKCKQKN